MGPISVNTSPRKSVIAHLKSGFGLLAFSVCVVTCYILSCPIVYRLSDNYHKRFPVGGFYKPLEIVNQSPSLRNAYLRWAGVWGVKYEFGLPCVLRARGSSFDRDSLSETYPIHPKERAYGPEGLKESARKRGNGGDQKNN